MRKKYSYLLECYDGLVELIIEDVSPTNPKFYIKLRAKHIIGIPLTNYEFFSCTILKTKLIPAYIEKGLTQTNVRFIIHKLKEDDRLRGTDFKVPKEHEQETLRLLYS